MPEGPPLPGYQVKHESIAIHGAADLQIRSLLDRQQFADPHGAAEALGISSATWPLFGLLWPSGLQLAAILAVRPVTPGERILELGCGLALASLVAHRRGADVTASDVHPLAGDFLAENLRLNAMAALPYRQGDWACTALMEHDDAAAQADPHAGQRVQGRFGLIMGSDVLYERDEQAHLPHFIERHGADDGEVMIVDPNRGNRSAFNRRMSDMGYELEESTLQPLPGSQAAYRGRMLHYRRGLARRAPAAAEAVSS